MNAWSLQHNQFIQRDSEEVALLPAQIRVSVEHLCLAPSDLERTGACVPGAALVGRVVETGAAASAWQDVQVLVPPLQSCGECETCRCGFVGVCPSRVILGTDIDGACAETIVAHTRWVTPLDNGLEGISGIEAAFVAGPLLTAYGLFARAGTGAGDVVLVLGQGPVAAVLFHLAETRGAKVLQAQSRDQAISAIAEHNSQNLPMRVLVCDGPQNCEVAVAVATPGSIVVSQLSQGAISVSALLQSELTFVAIPFTHPDLLPETAALVAKGDLAVSEFIVADKLGVDSPQAAQNAFASGKCLIAHH